MPALRRVKPRQLPVAQCGPNLSRDEVKITECLAHDTLRLENGKGDDSTIADFGNHRPLPRQRRMLSLWSAPWLPPRYRARGFGIASTVADDSIH